MASCAFVTSARLTCVVVLFDARANDVSVATFITFAYADIDDSVKAGDSGFIITNIAFCITFDLRGHGGHRRRRRLRRRRLGFRMDKHIDANYIERHAGIFRTA